MIDYKEIQKQFDKVIAYSQCIDKVNTDELFKTWATAKRGLYWLFDGLIKEVGHVSFEMPKQNKEHKFQDFIDYVRDFRSAEPLVHFLETIGMDDFFNNQTSIKYVEPSDEKKIVINAGAKVVKSFKYFVDGEMILQKLQNEASMLIQESKIEGTLCFSIHPLDFLSSSENRMNWRSCHSLDGEYRAGNLSYMGDEHTFMAYLKTDSDVILPHFPDDVPWNNKKWRCLMFVDDASYPKMVFAGRQYPFSAVGALNEVHKNLVNIFSTKVIGYHTERWSDWTDTYLKQVINPRTGEVEELLGQYIYTRGFVMEMEDLVKDAPNSRHYNDLLKSSCYTDPYYMYRDEFYAYPKLFTIGHEVNCVCCGHKPITYEDTMLCQECDNMYGEKANEMFVYCDYCGTRFPREDSCWVCGDVVCPDCMDSYVGRCDKCGEYFYNSEMRYTEEMDLCPDCYYDLFGKKEEG